VSLVAVLGCSGSEHEARYAAEKKFYQANKVKAEWAESSNKEKSRFIDRAIDEYRAIVDEFGDQTEVEGIEEIVLSAQMSLAEIELQTGRILEALDDFEKVADLEGEGLLVARMEALYRAAQLSERIRDYDRAMSLCERFYSEYLSIDNMLAMESIEPLHLTVPLTLSALARETDNPHMEALWLQRAETLYAALIDGSPAPSIVKQAGFNILTAYTQQRKWEKALAQLDKLEQRYEESADQVGVRFLRVKVYQEGLNDPAKASELCRSIYEDYPSSDNAPTAMLVDAVMNIRLGNAAGGEALYKRVVDDYGNYPNAVVEAKWQLASIEDARDEWPEALLSYKAIAAEYPTTRYGFESPLRIAQGFERRGDAKTAADAYGRAVDAYQKVVDGRHSDAIKLTAEDYILQVYVRQKRWQEAVEHLTGLVPKYPKYVAILQGNYLTAARIYENELNDDTKAVEMLRQCIDVYPESRAARTAEERIDRLSAQK
jgi:tetratricopeptide (TPR) repeat protein